MTGQVKEEILTRFGELGVQVEDGHGALPAGAAAADRVPDGTRRLSLTTMSRGEARSIEVPAGGLAFTFCQVPIVYRLTDKESWIRVTTSDGTTSSIAGDRLDADRSRALFDRTGTLSRIEVGIPESTLCRL